MPETTGICSPAHAPANTILIFATHFSIVPRSASLSSLGTRPCPVIFPQLGLATRVLSCVNVSIGQRLGADKCQLRWSSLFQSHDRTAETRLIFTILTSFASPISAASPGGMSRRAPAHEADTVQLSSVSLPFALSASRCPGLRVSSARQVAVPPAHDVASARSQGNSSNALVIGCVVAAVPGVGAATLKDWLHDHFLSALTRTKHCQHFDVYLFASWNTLIFVSTMKSSPCTHALASSSFKLPALMVHI